MNSRRTIILLVAIVVGAIASLGLLTYVRGVETEAQQDSAMGEVWIIKELIPRGTPGETAIASGFIVQQSVPLEFKPSTAVTDPNVELANLVAVTDLPANSPLVTGNFVTPSVITTGVTDRLEEKGLVTFTLSVDQIRGAAYMIQPGDFVNVLTVKPEEEATPTASGDPAAAPVAPVVTDSGPFSSTARYVYQRVEVIAIDKTLPADLGQAAAAEGEEAAANPNPGLITLGVPPEALQVLLSVGPENLYLSLIPSSYVPIPLPEVLEDTFATLLPGEAEGQLTPYWAMQETTEDAGTE